MAAKFDAFVALHFASAGDYSYSDSSDGDQPIPRIVCKPFIPRDDSVDYSGMPHMNFSSDDSDSSEGIYIHT